MDKLTHKVLTTSDGKLVTVSTHTRDGEPTSQQITTQDKGKTTIERVSGGKLIP